jgi:hypothetical protein
MLFFAEQSKICPKNHKYRQDLPPKTQAAVLRAD